MFDYLEQHDITDAKSIILTYHKGTQRSYIYLIHEKDYDRYRMIVDNFMKTWSKNGVFTEEDFDGELTWRC